MDSLLLVLTLLATEPAAADPAVRPGADPPRTIPITLVADPAFRALPRWRGTVREALELATADFPERAGLRLVPDEFLAWTPRGGGDGLEARLREAVAWAGPRPGLVLVLVGEGPAGDNLGPERGFAYLDQPWMIVTAPGRHDGLPGRSPAQKLALFIRHELGHVFGLGHRGDRNVMHPHPDARAWDFGVLGWAVLEANASRDFRLATPFAGSDLDLLLDAFPLLEERVGLDPVLWIRLGVALQATGRGEEAWAWFVHAGERDPDQWFRLARMEAGLGRVEDARAAYRRYLEALPRGPRAGAARNALARLPDATTGR